jgi:hypothetical protein
MSPRTLAGREAGDDVLPRALHRDIESHVPGGSPRMP